MTASIVKPRHSVHPHACGEHERKFFRDQMAHYAYEADEQKRMCTECHDELHAVTAELAQLKDSVVGVRKLLERPDVLEVLMRAKP